MIDNVVITYVIAACLYLHETSYKKISSSLFAPFYADIKWKGDIKLIVKKPETYVGATISKQQIKIHAW